VSGTNVICFANNKGGSGKSTTCSNIGYGLSVLGKKVLLVDGDMQLNLSLSLFEEDQVLKSTVFTWPVKGAVLRDYSVETLSLDPTLGDWRTHGGLDIAAAQGVQVISMSAGTVSKVYEDGLMGTTVVVDHGGGLQSWYCNLAPEPSVQEGDTVEIGGVLGRIGGSAIAEVGVGSHLHLETTLDGQMVDPREYLPQ